MDIQIALGKIEQYWQIIRNLHFHIEQEGKISPEEYALIDKYLKVISRKYQELIEEAPEMTEILPAKTFSHITKANPVPLPEQKLPEIIPVPSVEEQVAEQKIVVPHEPEEIFFAEKQQEETPSVIENIAPEIIAEAPKSKSISSYLEQMLESPEKVPEKPLLFTNDTAEKKATSLNDRLKEMRTPVEDLNSRIKRATAEKISLNDKFEFIRELFGNNPVEYATAIQYFDTYGTYAWEKVENEFAVRFNWTSKPGTVEKLKGLVTGK